MDPDMTPSIAAATVGTDGLAVRWNDNTNTTFPWFWLRDHGCDPDSLNHKTLQRKIDTFSIPPDIHGIKVNLSGDGGLTIHWNTPDAVSRFSAGFLAQCAGRLNGHSPPPEMWDADSLPDPLPGVRYGDVMEDERALHLWLGNIQRFGFSLITETDTSEEGTRKLAERIGYVRQTIFGGVWTLSSAVTAHDDTAYSTAALEPHTDATYCHDAPALQLFNCVQREGTGGESILVDGFAAARDLKAQHPDYFKTLSDVSVPARYIEDGVHLKAERPPLRLDAAGQVIQVSFNNYDRAPFLLPPAQMDAFYQAYGWLHRRVCESRHWLKIPLQPASALIFDNWRLLHGRTGYTGRRAFVGCYMNREDLESKLRTVGLLSDSPAS